MTPTEIIVLVKLGYQQISARHGLIARLPPGKTALEALRDADPQLYTELVGGLERQAKSMYLRTYAQDRRTLSPEELKAFRAAGGDVA